VVHKSAHTPVQFFCIFRDPCLFHPRSTSGDAKRASHQPQREQALHGHHKSQMMPLEYFLTCDTDRVCRIAGRRKVLSTFRVKLKLFCTRVPIPVIYVCLHQVLGFLQYCTRSLIGQRLVWKSRRKVPLHGKPPQAHLGDVPSNGQQAQRTHPKQGCAFRYVRATWSSECTQAPKSAVHDASGRAHPGADPGRPVGAKITNLSEFQ
jgi:hypothetical protein